MPRHKPATQAKGRYYRQAPPPVGRWPAASTPAVVTPPPLVVGVVAAVHPGFALGVLGSLLGMLAVLVGLTTIGGRLLDVRMSWWRALVAACPGFLAGLTFVWAVSGRRHGPQHLSVPAILGAALIATMLLTALLELLARPGSITSRTACAGRWRKPAASSSSLDSCCRPARTCSHRT